MNETRMPIDIAMFCQAGGLNNMAHNHHTFTLKLVVKQVKQVYNDQPLGTLALGKIRGGNGFLVSFLV